MEAKIEGNLDSVQDWHVRWFAEHSVDLGLMAGGTNHFRTTDTARDNEAPGRVEELANVFGSIARDVPNMSSQSGNIRPEEAEQYLSQELLRLYYKRRLLRWLKDYRAGRADMRRRLMDPGNAEETLEEGICSQGYERLGGDLSLLEDEEQMRRACYILGAIQTQRRRLRWQFTTSPVRTAGAACASFTATIASYFDWLTASLAASGTAAQYAWHAPSSLREYRTLKGPEQDAREIVGQYARKNPMIARLHLAEVEVEGDKVLGGL